MQQLLQRSGGSRGKTIPLGQELEAHGTFGFVAHLTSNLVAETIEGKVDARWQSTRLVKHEAAPTFGVIDHDARGTR